MLLKIREKAQGVFAWVILVLICVPFALWGIQNYLGGGTEKAIAQVGDREFYQQDLNQAYAQYTQQLAGREFDEAIVKKQALQKLIQDELLWQQTRAEKIVVTDEMAAAFIESLEYFQTDGKFNNKQYKALLAAQRISSAEFVQRIKKALAMQQLQTSVIQSAFTTDAELENFFKIQNQTRNVDVISIALPNIAEKPSDEDIKNYYQDHSADFMTDETIEVNYVELSLDKLAEKVEVEPKGLKDFYEEQKDRYQTPERRRISHILFAFTDNTDDDSLQLQKALKAKEELKTKDFAQLANEQSDDKLTADKGGDLGLFNKGVMEPAFEQAVNALQLGEVSEPVKSEFGYHLIKVTELTPGSIKSFAEVENEITQAYKKAQAENTFYQMGERLTEISYENPDNLSSVQDILGLEIKKAGPFTRNPQQNIDLNNDLVINDKFVTAAFSNDVLKGNNSEPVEISTERLVVLHVTAHELPQLKPLENVSDEIVAAIQIKQAREMAKSQADELKVAIESGADTQSLLDQHEWVWQSYPTLGRNSGELAWNINQAIFKAPKPTQEKPTVITVADMSGGQVVVKLKQVIDGVMTDSDKAKKDLASLNIANAYGQAEFDAFVESLKATTTVTVNLKEDS